MMLWMKSSIQRWVGLDASIVLARAQVSCAMHCCLRAHCMALQGGFVIPKRERARIDATGGSSSYGEVQAAGVDQLLK